MGKDVARVPMEMALLFNKTSLFRFLYYTNKSPLEKKILDCGAGGVYPPLALFSSFGYETYGVDIDKRQLRRANAFLKKYAFSSTLLQEDMRKLPFEDDSFSFAYTYNSIFHMEKRDMVASLSEMARVVRKGGLIYFNVLTSNENYVPPEQGYVMPEIDTKDFNCAKLPFAHKVIYRLERRVKSNYCDDIYSAGFVDYYLQVE